MILFCTIRAQYFHLTVYLHVRIETKQRIEKYISFSDNLIGTKQCCKKYLDTVRLILMIHTVIKKDMNIGNITVCYLRTT